jgi:site-specific DNA recombinase
MNNLKNEFLNLATDGYLGDPHGFDAYAYLRASSERQVEEGSSFTRQIENIHKAAARDGLRVPFSLIFFDDGYTGFEFEHRPALLKLRYEVRITPRAHYLVLEDIDRLSRNADWQQGFLLEELFRSGIEVHFYISPGSALERYVRGYMAQEEMKKARERMKMGSIYKAMAGKVTAKRPRYGYVITEDSLYELHAEESKTMRWIYEKLIYDRLSLYKIAGTLNDWGIPTRFKTKFWTASTLIQLVKSPVYKGEFYANRHFGIPTGEYRENGKPKNKMVQRPREEWIFVPVPAIVTPEEWELAQEVLKDNAKRSMRNAKKREWLLIGLLKCDICHDYSYTAQTGSSNQRKRYYKCNSWYSEKARGLDTCCKSPYVFADVLEKRVWEEIEKLIYDPEIILHRLEEKTHEEQIIGYEEQLAFVNRQLTELTREKEKFEAAYQRDIYTLDEFEEKMNDIRFRKNSLEVSLSKIEAKIAETYSLEEQKQVVIEALSNLRERVEKARKNGQVPKELPLELKRKILTLIVDVIWVNTVEQTFTIEGEINGTFSLDDSNDDNIPPTNTNSAIGSNFGFLSSRRWR